MNKNKDTQKQQEELLKTLGDFTSKQNWDDFFTIRGTDDSFEWYAEWTQLSSPLLTHLSNYHSQSAQILVPGCGNSKLSEHLYDAGFRSITNVDFSKVVISDMLRRNVRDRPGMRWRVMDMTQLQFADETFDVVLDKGGLDALMEPELGSDLGNRYLSEVKRVLNDGGKFICLTLAEAHVLGLLFPKFRYGWSVSLEDIPQKASKKPSLTTFMLIAKKESSLGLQQVTSSIHSSTGLYGDQARGLFEALETENKLRTAHLNGSDILYSLEDLRLGAKGDLSELRPGRRVQLTLGEPGCSQFLYKAVLLDAQQQSDSFLYHCGVFLVPKTRAHEWIFSSEEGQWTIVESSKAARLIMVLLDSSHANASTEDIQKDLSPLVKQLEPGKNDSGALIPFMAAGDGIKKRNVVHQVDSALTGPVIVDDVIYENVDDDISRLFRSKELIFRRLTFERSMGLVQSEALLIGEGCKKTVSEKEQKKSRPSSKSRKRGNQKGNSSNVPPTNENSAPEIDHDYLASSYHTGIVSGLMLISSFLETVSSSGRMVKTVVIGLGAGLLPMFLHRSLQCLSIEVVELDAVILDLARDYFGFRESDHMKVHITDGIQFLKDVPASSGVANGVNPNDKSCSLSNASANVSEAEGKWIDKIGLLIVDVDSSDSSSGMTCPAADFVEESFLFTVRDSLSDTGLFVVNLVSRSASTKDMVLARMKMVFGKLFSLQLEEDVNEVIFALKTEDCIMEDSFHEASQQLGKLLTLKHPELIQNITDVAKKIKHLN